MAWPRVRFRIGTMMLGVAIAALLLSVPLEDGLTLFVSIIAVWTVPLVLQRAFQQAFGERDAARFAFGLVAGLLSPLLLPVLSPERDAIEIAVLVLTPLNVMGPFHAAWQLGCRRRLLAGEILWAWAGLVWPFVFPAWVHHHAYERLAAMAECARLTAVVALLLIRYGTRPLPRQPRWAHRAGWLIMECDVFVWGWYAGWFLR